ncbi:anti-sigma-factor antagonist [Methanoregula boonei 6A8]|jgi:anti-anti-sigma factor|uniref:Anti-sigma-factor antagonist n=1 Tax=Methanoregula boonei (strain DSM 21154 / JCM 14090 / 6A8) TaxID=456442 RepID=A7I7G6_METB6|nr:STAS domain-containing protein [Methanoregula boonei]ABS55677.1 anti-sigma-factor antagonist [Methanoregula boonei 6A8]
MDLPETTFTLTVAKHDTAAILSVKGRIDATTAGEFEGAINSHIGMGERQIILDLSGLAYISSGGLRVLLATAKKLHSNGDRFVLCGLSVEVQKVMNLAGFTTIFSIYATVSDALAAVSSPK